MNFHHIGIACFDIPATAAFYISMGYHCSDETFDSVQNVKIAFLSKSGQPLIELLAPVDCSSPIYRILQKEGVTPYHICYVTENIIDTVTSLKKMKFILVKGPAPASALNNKKVCFLFKKEVGLIELLEN